MRFSQRAGIQALFISLILVGLGLVMVYSASSVLASVKFSADPSFFLERQLLRAGIGLFAMVLLSRVPVNLWACYARPLLLVAFVLLIVVLVVGAGRNTSRWIWLGGFAFQPSEFVKLVIVLYLADVLSRQRETMVDFSRGLLPRLIVLTGLLGLIAMQPDLGTSIAVGLVAAVMLWIGGARLSHLLGCLLVSVPLIATSLVMLPYQGRRLLAFIEAGDAQGSNYQLLQSLLALGSGGVLGVGLGNSAQKQQFLPEPHTDFVFSLIGEELGLAGTLSVIALFIAFGMHGLRIAREAPTYHGFLLATGLTAMISVYAILNMGVVTGLLPTTGLPLPFISYGGSALLWNLAGVGILMGISRSRQTVVFGSHEQLLPDMARRT